jgi:hypothetical protein
MFSGTLYNGSSWTVSRVVFQVTAKDANGETRWARELSDDVEIGPLATGGFSAQLIDYKGVVEFPWGLEAVYGFLK